MSSPEDVTAAVGNIDWSAGVSVNVALVFLKPHAATDEAKAWLDESLTAAGCRVCGSGSLTAEQIESDKLVDKHYSSIAKAACEVPAAEQAIGEGNKEEFAEKFELGWADATIGNASEAAAALGVPLGTGGIFDFWEAAGKDAGFKLGPGLYIRKIEYVEVEPDEEGGPKARHAPGEDGATAYYCINGFYGGMREKFVAEGAKVTWFVVAFESSKLTWAQFRGEVIGATDPEKASKASLRGKLMDMWEELGLKDAPNTGDNGVHASAGPLEGLKERMVWVGFAVDKDPFGEAVVDICNGDVAFAEGLLENPVREFPPGTEGPIFDITEDTDSLEVLVACNNLCMGDPAKLREYYPVATEAEA